MDDSFDLLEGRIRRAAELVQKLRGDNAKLADELEKTRKRGQEAEKRLAGLDKKGVAGEDLSPKVESLTREMEALKREREEFRRRIERLVGALEEIG
jgi:predicted RNase H-like nuclease (RuvC/YqgF family)